MHGHDHAHHTHASDLGRILKVSTILTLVFVAVALAAGWYAHSLALISDAWHNFSDALALLLSWFAVYIQSRPPNPVKTFGYHRAGVLAAVVNAVTLVGIALYIFYESYERLKRPQTVDSTIMMAVSLIGLGLNTGIAAALFRSAKGDLNIRSAFIHLVGDALGSVAVMIGAVAIRFTGVSAIDPILSILIGVLILWTSWDIIKEALNVLLEGLPRGMTLPQVADAVRGVRGVIDVHDLHVWTLGPRMLALSCHLCVADIPLSESREILNRVNQLLEDRFHIGHTTIQLEHAPCVEPCAVNHRT